jgi:hypothetical protein
MPLERAAGNVRRINSALCVAEHDGGRRDALPPRFIVVGDRCAAALDAAAASSPTAWMPVWARAVFQSAFATCDLLRFRRWGFCVVKRHRERRHNDPSAPRSGRQRRVVLVIGYRPPKCERNIFFVTKSISHLVFRVVIMTNHINFRRKIIGKNWPDLQQKVAAGYIISAASSLDRRCS